MLRFSFIWFSLESLIVLLIIAHKAVKCKKSACVLGHWRGFFFAKKRAIETVKGKLLYQEIVAEELC